MAANTLAIAVDGLHTSQTGAIVQLGQILQPGLSMLILQSLSSISKDKDDITTKLVTLGATKNIVVGEKLIIIYLSGGTLL